MPVDLKTVQTSKQFVYAPVCRNIMQNGINRFKAWNMNGPGRTSIGKNILRAIARPKVIRLQNFFEITIHRQLLQKKHTAEPY